MVSCFPFLLTFLFCSSLLVPPATGTGTLVGLVYNARDNAATSSSSSTMSFLPSYQIPDLGFLSSRRELRWKVHTSIKDGGVTPTIITVPATIPMNTPPTNPVTPLPLPVVTNPATTTTSPPVTVPGAAAGGVGVTNPATTYPAPSAATGTTVPPALTNPVVAPPAVTNPVAVPPPALTNPAAVAPPAAPTTTNPSPAVAGQSWCVAKAGSSVTALQGALDYACGTGGVDCSQIQQGAACFNPNTLQNHASFAFNSYYQKNPVATSCDFGGTAAVVTSNPSSGTCTYPSSSSSSSSSSTSSPPATPTTTSPLTPASPTPSTSSTNPVTTNPATTPSPPASNGASGTNVTPPMVLNSSSNTPTGGTATVFGFDTPPGVTPGPMTSTSNSLALQPFLLGVLLMAGAVVFDA